MFATSVFTHLRAGDAENYFREIGRCLKPGKAAYGTLFAMTPERWARAEAGKAFIPFERFGDGAYVGSFDVPEATIAFDESIILGWIAAAELTVAGPMQEGGLEQWRPLPRTPGRAAAAPNRRLKRISGLNLRAARA